MRLFDGETTNTTSAALTGAGVQRTVYVWGTFGGATVKVQVSPDQVEWFDVDALTFASKAAINTSFQGAMRAVIEGGTGHAITVDVL